jgi:beta-lactam-binding protein with PASTA domain
MQLLILKTLAYLCQNLKNMSLIKFFFTKVFWKQVAYAVVGIGLLIFLLFLWLNITTNHNQKIQVPDLSKQSLDDVEMVLNDLDLQYIVQDSASYNPNYPKKSVIKQNPEPGDIVKEKRKIYLTLNPSGYRNIAIPEFFGKTRRNVETTLRAVGFEIGNKPTWVLDRGKNVVRGIKHNGKEIKKGDKLPKKSVINLVIGDGKG